MTNNKTYRTSILMLLPLVLVFVLMPSSASAQLVQKSKDAAKVVSQQDANTDDDEKLDDSFRKFGRAAGGAYQCAADTEKEKVAGDARKAFNRIGQLFGTDRAFSFAASFGKATEEQFDKSKCAELITKLRESILVKRALAN